MGELITLHLAKVEDSACGSWCGIMFHSLQIALTLRIVCAGAASRCKQVIGFETNLLPQSKFQIVS